MTAFVGFLALHAPLGRRIVQAARAQVGVTRAYDPEYHSLAYPGGDVPLGTGVCTDVVIRALRSAMHVDLQRLVHEDMLRHFSAYPRKYHKSRPDANIDHRRVDNLRTFFRRRGWELPASTPYAPGDFVTCILPGNHDHIMVVSDRRAPSGRYLVVHNIGAGAKEEDCLYAFRVTGHYRVRG